MAWVSMEPHDLELIRALRPYVSSKANELIATLLELTGSQAFSEEGKPSIFSLEKDALMGVIESHTRKAFFLFLILLLLLASANAFAGEPATGLPEEPHSGELSSPEEGVGLQS